MKEILFSKFVFHSGINMTVRKGSKVYPKDVILISSNTTDHPILAKVLVDKNIVCRFCDISAIAIEMEHDPDCRSYSGLLQVMQNLYPGFKQDDEVTCVFFTTNIQSYVSEADTDE